MISNRKRPSHIKIKEDSPYYKMSYKGYISRARLNMATHLNRCIGSDEYLYFEDGNCFNEEISNLRLVSHKELNVLNGIRRITSHISVLSEKLKYYSSELERVRFNKTPCNCRKCRLSLDARQATYRV